MTDYPFMGAKSSGGDKLASSAVAPLVASARGYFTATEDTFDQNVKDMRLGRKNSYRANQLAQAIGTSDAMVMPWYIASDVASEAQENSFPQPTTFQLRPRGAVMGADGKPMKYINLAQTSTVLDIHPATPASWIQHPDRIVFTEGLMKADSALTALLADLGVDITFDEDADHNEREAAAFALRSAMEKVPAGQRTLIVAFVGVGNWSSNFEWTSLNIRNTEVFIAFDADVATNYQVWNQANKLFTYLEENKKTKPPKLVILPDDTDGGKMGIDDFFAQGGTWSDMLDESTDKLPERPPKSDTDELPGTWRANNDTYNTEELVATDQGGMVWRPVVPLIGRVISIETRRSPSDEEVRSGVMEAIPTDRAVPDAQVEIEVSWLDQETNTQVHTAIVSGPQSILVTSPKDWNRQDAKIPVNLAMNPNWPPEQPEKWLKATKANNEGKDVTALVRWTSMGWAPRTGNAPHFIVGDQSIDVDGIHTEYYEGVSEDDLDGASDFGVCQYSDEDMKNYKEAVARDIVDVVKGYTVDGPWNSENGYDYGPTILCLGLRPTIPIPTSVVAWFAGRSKSGKSFSASQVMQFWQPRAGVWTDGNLPGAAKDTDAAMEYSVSKTPIWVADDFAPSVSRVQAEREENSLETLVRSIHNRRSKRRMNADMKTREVHHPRALFIITAENEPTTASVQNRAIILRFRNGALKPTDDESGKLRYFAERNPAPARLTGAMIRFLCQMGSSMTWPIFTDELHRMHDECMEIANSHFSGSKTDENGDPVVTGAARRHASIAADAIVTIQVLALMAEYFEVDDPLVQQMLGMNGAPSTAITSVLELMHNSYEEQAESTPGNSLLVSVRSLLREGMAHVSRASDLGAPTGSHSANRDLGWREGSDGTVSPAGPRIGSLVEHVDNEGTSTMVVVLDSEAAFRHAKRNYSERIPHGSKAASAWESLWDEGYTYNKIPRRKSKHREMNTVQIRSTDGGSVSGVPVALSTLLDYDIYQAAPERIRAVN